MSRFLDGSYEEFIGEMMDKLEAGIVMANTIRREGSTGTTLARKSQGSSCVAKLACKLGHWARDSKEGLPAPARQWLSDSIDSFDSWLQLPKLFSRSFHQVYNDVDDSACDSSCYRCIAL